jgi:hypothetical protein
MPIDNTPPGAGVNSPQGRNRKQPKQQYTYHWDRIVGAVSVLAALVGLLGYAAYQWLQPVGEAADRKPGAEPGSGGYAAAAAAEPESVVANQRGLPVPAGGIWQSTKIPGGAPTPEGNAAADGARRPAQDPQPPQADASSTASSYEVDGPTGFVEQEVTRLSGSVNRFLLAKSVVNNEPVGHLGAIVPDGSGVSAVYCFSDVLDMKDEVLYYDWLHDGRRVARVRVGVWGNRWRSHSSKVMNSRMKGNWRVELRRADGDELMASAEFIYR